MKLETKLKGWDIADVKSLCRNKNNKRHRKTKKQLFGKLKAKCKRFREKYDAAAE